MTFKDLCTKKNILLTFVGSILIIGSASYVPKLWNKLRNKKTKKVRFENDENNES